ncbi:MAG: hypothetical protein KBS79_04975 [Lachnospiraceae bacterium]|nr:hypothetical protein [Candidatus Minthocola equi]
MEQILAIRQKCKELYSNYDVYIMPVLKFITALISILVINNAIGFEETLAKWNVILIAALVCAILPWAGITFVLLIFVMFNLLALSWEVALVALCLVILAAILQYLFLPGFSIIIILIPVLYYLNIPFVIPLIVGLVGGPTAFIPACSGVFSYYFIQGVEKNATFFATAATSQADILEQLMQVLSIIQDNKIMQLSIISTAISVLIVYFIRHIKVDFAPYLAVGFGAVANVVSYLIGGFVMEITIPYVTVFVGTLISLVIALVISLWIIAADYNHSEYLQYEDDDYVYYVKAVPKIKVAPSKVKVHDITADQDDADIQEALQMLDDYDEQERRGK